MMTFTLYDTISGEILAEHASAEGIMAQLGLTEEQFWRAVGNENYLYKSRYEIIMETKEYKGSIVMTIEEKATFIDGWIMACKRLAEYAGLKVGWLEDEMRVIP